MSSLVQQSGNQLTCTVRNEAEAKLAIKELKLLKQGFSLQKRDVVAAMQAIRFEHSQGVKSRVPMLRGGGGLGRFVRAVQSSSHASARANLASSLAPLEQQKRKIEENIFAVDEMILRIQVAMHDG